MEAEHHNHSNKPSRVTRAKIVRPVNKDEGKITAGLRPWHHPSSRIFRVSRASGGKDRHSKVYTSKGLRDRRVRLSVSTAIQFYDLQDRLGYDQPSKAIEWLIKKASAAIIDLPSLEGTYEPLKLEEKPEVGHEVNQLDEMQQQHDCSSTSETSKGSDHQAINSSLNPPDSFTELLTSNGASGIQKPIPYMPGYASPIGMVPFNITAPETQHLSLLQDHQIPIAAYAAGDYNFNFAISPGVAGFNRGTLQSNSRPQLPYHLLQRFSSPVERSSLPFFFGASAAAATSAEQLCFGDGLRHSDMKGKGKS